MCSKQGKSYERHTSIVYPIFEVNGSEYMEVNGGAALLMATFSLKTIKIGKRKCENYLKICFEGLQTCPSPSQTMKYSVNPIHSHKV